MNKEMIVSSNGHETMVAILEDDLVAEVFVERERQRGVVGNVYKGRVSKVLPGMQSAFVDLGLERDGFLYVTDVVASLEELDRFETEDEDVSAAPSGQAGGNGGSSSGGGGRAGAGATASGGGSAGQGSGGRGGTGEIGRAHV